MKQIQLPALKFDHPQKDAMARENNRGQFKCLWRARLGRVTGKVNIQMKWPLGKGPLVSLCFVVDANWANWSQALQSIWQVVCPMLTNARQQEEHGANCDRQTKAKITTFSPSASLFV